MTTVVTGSWAPAAWVSTMSIFMGIQVPLPCCLALKEQFNGTVTPHIRPSSDSHMTGVKGSLDKSQWWIPCFTHKTCPLLCCHPYYQCGSVAGSIIFEFITSSPLSSIHSMNKTCPSLRCCPHHWCGSVAGRQWHHHLQFCHFLTLIIHILNKQDSPHCATFLTTSVSLSPVAAQ